MQNSKPNAAPPPPDAETSRPNEPAHASGLPRHRHSRHAVNLRLERWHRRAIYLSSALLLLSGAAWLLLHYFLRVAGEFGELPNPLEPWSMKLHGAAAMLMLFFLGSLLNAHIRRAIKSDRNLLTGWGMIVVMSLLVATGYALYYFAADSDRAIWSAAHWIIGLAGSVLFLLHILIGRRSHGH